VIGVHRLAPILATIRAMRTQDFGQPSSFSSFQAVPRIAAIWEGWLRVDRYHTDQTVQTEA